MLQHRIGLAIFVANFFAKDTLHPGDSLAKEIRRHTAQIAVLNGPRLSLNCA